jgi:hypothetical protein
VSSGRGCLRCARWIAPAFPDGSRRHALRVARGEVIEREGHIVALEIDLDRAVDRFAEAGELVERGPEKALLHDAADSGDQDDEAGLQRLSRVLRRRLHGGDQLAPRRPRLSGLEAVNNQGTAAPVPPAWGLRA